MIRFAENTNKNIWKVCTLEPFEEQKDFVAENIQSLAKAYAMTNPIRSLSLYTAKGKASGSGGDIYKKGK